jgi:DNA polymerase III subunit epsilon
MDNKTHYDPDYHQLNRKAKRCPADGSSKQTDKLLDRLLPRSWKPAPICHDPELFVELDETISAIKSAIDWGQNLFEATYVVLDTETTGLQPYKGDEIISIGAVIIEGAQISEERFFYQLVNPRRPIPALAQKITGLDDAMVKDQPEIIAVLLEFLKFAGPKVLVAHNAPFDLAFINSKVAEAVGRRIVNPVIDTVMLTSALYYAIGDYSLENLAERFSLSLEGRHNALADARIAASLYLKLLPELKARGVNTLHQLAGLFSEIDLTKGYPLIF